jgi:hypothetical protein
MFRFDRDSVAVVGHSWANAYQQLLRDVGVAGSRSEKSYTTFTKASRRD